RLREANDLAEVSGARTHPDREERLARMVGIVLRARGAGGVEEMIEAALTEVRGALSFDRVLFLQVDLEEERLHGKYLFDDTRIDVDVHDITLPLNPDGLIGAALRDGSAQRVDNWATDGELLRYLGVVEVAAAPIVVNQRPLGIVCADYFFLNREITDEDVALLGILGTDLGLAVENLALGRQAAKLRALAAMDELTGVNNRRNLMKLLQKEIDRAKRYGSPLSAVMVDIDHFKKFNDTYGHQAGDTILTEVAQLITAASRDIDIIGRYGGEEFLVILPETHVDQAIVYAERLRAGVEHFGKQSQKAFPRCPLTISVGVTALTRERDGIEQVVRRVDHALYAAKERGRNRVCVD
ncbi:MAG: GGDEF domain-containing protein, partial [Planctomycetota bacterium]